MHHSLPLYAHKENGVNGEDCMAVDDRDGAVDRLFNCEGSNKIIYMGTGNLVLPLKMQLR